MEKERRKGKKKEKFSAEAESLDREVKDKQVSSDIDKKRSKG